MSETANDTATRRTFALADLLSVTTGHLLCADGMAGLHRMFAFMTGDDFLTDRALLMLRGRVSESIGRQYPHLANLKIPASVDSFSWLERQEAEFGEFYSLFSLIGEEP